jgi:Domain of unknown function (DU1801)
MVQAKNKTQATGASVAEFLETVEPDRRDDARALARLIGRVTKAKPKMWGTAIVGFGDYHYESASGRGGDWFLAGFSPRKAALTVYLMGGARMDAKTAARLGRHKTGGGCLYLRRLEDVDLKVLEEIVRGSVRALKARARAQP